MKGKAERAGLKATLVRIAGTAVNLSAGDAGGLPTRMKILNWGANPNARGKAVVVGERLVRAFNAPTYPFRTIPLDFEHNTLEGTPAYAESSEPRKIAAHCGVEIVPGDGVYLTAPRWTPDGLENAAHYCDLSAAPVTDPDGNVLAVISAALCRTGAVPGMEFADVPVSLSADALAAMDTQQTEGHVDWRKMLCAALGKKDDVSDEELQGALTEALAKPDATALNAQIGKAVETALKPLQEQVTALNAAGQATAAEFAKRDKAQALQLARFEGKVVALNASAVEAMSLKDLQEHIQALPVTVPLSARTPDVMDPDKGGGMTDAQRTIALNCGADPDKVFGKK